MTKKACFKCKKKKSLSGFYRHNQMKDGYLNKCKECAKKDVLDHRSLNLDKIRAYDRKRSKLPHRIKLRAETTKRYKKDFPLRYKAHCIVNNAIRSGKLKKPKRCSICKKIALRIEGHHDDYTKPLKVKWLCTPCHRCLDRDLRNASKQKEL